MTPQRKNEIAFLYLVNALKRKRFAIPSINDERLQVLAQSLDTAASEVTDFLSYLQRQKRAPLPFGHFNERRGQLSLAFLNLCVREEGFTFQPIAMRKQAKKTAKEVGISEVEACIFIRQLLKDLVDEVFPEEE